MTSSSHTQKGFTLIETLIAVAILTTAIIGPFVAIQTAITASYVARDQLTATMLAQEGVEFVRSIRDGNYLYNITNPTPPLRSWLYGLDGSGGSVNCVDPDSPASPYNCTVDPIGTTPVQLCPTSGTGTCPPLNYSTANVYTQTAGSPATRFTRRVTLITVSATEVRVVVTVAFTTNHKSYSVVLDEHLYNWL